MKNLSYALSVCRLFIWAVGYIFAGRTRFRLGGM